MPQEYLEKKLFEAYKETEKRVFKESFYHAICHDNLHLVEILIDKGFDYTQLLGDTRSAIIICTDKDTVRVLEYLLIISVRENNFYTFNDLHYVLNWALANRHYEVIDILLYALKQDSQSPQSFVKFITIKDLMTAFGDIAKSGHDIPKNQMLNLKNLITSNPISKRQMNYLYYIWSEVFEENHLQGQEIYNWLSDSYYALDKDRRTKKVSREIVISAFFSPLLVLAAGLLYIISQDVYLGLNNMLSGDLSSMQTPITSHRYLFVFLLFSLYLGIVALGHSAVKLFLSSIKNIF